jgi:hypothetical protein
MPRLLPPEWIKQIAITRLLKLYENDSMFVAELAQLKQPYASLITELTQVQIFIDLIYLLTRHPPRDFVGWVQDLQRLKNYFRSPYLPTQYSPKELEERNSQIRDKLAPYMAELARLAHKWNIRAPWAAEALLQKDISVLEEQVYADSGVTLLNKLSDEQVQTILGHENPSFPSERFVANVLSIYQADGRTRFLAKLSTQLARLEEKAKKMGIKEIPSALDQHIEWWFLHYVKGLTYDEISAEILQSTSATAPDPKNIRNAVTRLSRSLDITPVKLT